MGLPALATPLRDETALPTAFDFDAVYAELFPFVWRTARRLGVADAALDDVCQEVFVAVYRGLAQFTGRSSLKSWVFGILQNSVRMHRRTLARKSPNLRSHAPPIDPSELSSEQPSPHDLLCGAEARQLAHDLLEEMAEDKRSVFVLVELEQWSVIQAAEALNENVNTIHARLRAAREQFAKGAARIAARARWRTE